MIPRETRGNFTPDSRDVKGATTESDDRCKVNFDIHACTNVPDNICGPEMAMTLPSASCLVAEL